MDAKQSYHKENSSMVDLKSCISINTSYVTWLSIPI